MKFQGLNSETLLHRIKELFEDSNCPPISGLLRAEVSGAVTCTGLPKLQLNGLSWIDYIPSGLHGVLICHNQTRTFIHSKGKELSSTEVALSLFYAFESYFIDAKANKDLLWDIIWWKIWILQEFQKTLPEIIICNSDADTDSVGPEWEKFQIMLQHLRIAEMVAEGSTNHFSMFTPGAPTEKFERSARSRKLYEWRKSAIADCVRFLAGVLENPIEIGALNIETLFEIDVANAHLQPNSCRDLCIKDLERLCTSTSISAIRAGYLLCASKEINLLSDRFFTDLNEFLTIQWPDVSPPMN